MAQVEKNEDVRVLLEETQYQLLTANKKVTEAVVAVSNAYQQAAEAVLNASFAQWKAFNSFVTKQTE